MQARLAYGIAVLVLGAGCGGAAAPLQQEEPVPIGASPVPGSAASSPQEGVDISIGGSGMDVTDADPPPGGVFVPTSLPDPCAPGMRPPRGDVVRLLLSGGRLRWYAVRVPCTEVRRADS